MGGKSVHSKKSLSEVLGHRNVTVDANHDIIDNGSCHATMLHPHVSETCGLGHHAGSGKTSTSDILIFV